jgi:hypothetical protein
MLSRTGEYMRSLIGLKSANCPFLLRFPYSFSQSASMSGLRNYITKIEQF